MAIQRRKDKKQYKFNEKINISIEKLILEQYSPAQIVDILKRENTETMSPEYIYQHLYKDKKNGGDLYIICDKRENIAKKGY